MKAKPKLKQDREPSVVLYAKCIMGHKFTMSEEDVQKANDVGCALCPTCGNPAVVTKISGASA